MDILNSKNIGFYIIFFTVLVIGDFLDGKVIETKI